MSDKIDIRELCIRDARGETVVASESAGVFARLVGSMVSKVAEADEGVGLTAEQRIRLARNMALRVVGEHAPERLA